MGLADGGQKALMETYKESKNKKQRVEENKGARVVQTGSATGREEEEEGQVQGWGEMEEGENEDPTWEEYNWEADEQPVEGWNEGEDEACDDPHLLCEDDEQWGGGEEQGGGNERNEEWLDGEKDDGGEGEIEPNHLPPGYGTTWVWRTYTYFD